MRGSGAGATGASSAKAGMTDHTTAVAMNKTLRIQPSLQVFGDLKKHGADHRRIHPAARPLIDMLVDDLGDLALPIGGSIHERHDIDRSCLDRALKTGDLGIQRLDIGPLGRLKSFGDLSLGALSVSRLYGHSLAP